jgi:uncharacterized protein (DUF1800 family)
MNLTSLSIGTQGCHMRNVFMPKTEVHRKYCLLQVLLLVGLLVLCISTEGCGSGVTLLASKVITPTLTFAVIANHTYGDSPFPISASSTSNGVVTYAVASGPATISGNMVTLIGAGTVILRAMQAADTDNAAQSATSSFIVNPAMPDLAFAPIASQTLGGAPFSISAASPSSGSISYAVVSGPASISGNRVTLTGTGVVDLSATQAAAPNYTSQIAAVSFNVNALSSSSSTGLTVHPEQLSGGAVTLNLSGTGFLPGYVVFLDGKPLATTINSSSSISAVGYLAPWETGSVVMELFGADGTQSIASETIPIIPTAVTFDAAARFTTQAAFGPRPDVVVHIQQVGFDAFITEQFNQPTVAYSTNAYALTTFLQTATTGNSLLRQRVAWALQNFIVWQTISEVSSDIPIESTLERDASANFRTLMSDVAADPYIGTFLNLVNNPTPTDPSIHPNQNFARELMQLFTLGPERLNDDGSIMLDSSGQPIPTYDQNTVIDLTRAFTGWTYPIPVNPDYTFYGVDYTQPLSGNDSQHDHAAKLLFDAVVLPAGQTIEQDRDAALDAIFNHPNLPPFISRLLIQHLVKSNPSPAYVQRMSQVFENDGTGVRGNLAAVVRAILLDSEARLGDTTPSADDGFIQDPILFETFTESILQVQGGDGQPDFIPQALGEAIWNSPTVFGFYSPSFVIPGTSINAPEFALFNNITALQRSQILWGIISSTQPGFGPYLNTSWLFANFTTVPDMITALNHLVYHGNMSATEQQVILNYCSQMNPFLTTQQLQTAVFLALNADSYTVSN